MNLKDISTKELTDELIKREGIIGMKVNPYDNVILARLGKSKLITGPAIIIINQD